MRPSILVLCLVLLAACGAGASGTGSPAPEAVGVAGDTTIYAMEGVTERPHLVNPAHVQQAFARYFPDVLKSPDGLGEPTFTFVVEPDGRPSNITLTRSSGQPEADSAARRVIRTMRFSPGRIGGRAVRVRATMPISMRMGS